MTLFFECSFGDRVYKHFKDGCKGYIVGVFSSAIYCCLENGEIILFHDSKYGIIPFGIGLKGINSFLSKTRFTVDSQFQCVNFVFTSAGSADKVIFRPECVQSELLSTSEICFTDYIYENISEAESILRTKSPGCIKTILSLAGGKSYYLEAETKLNDIAECDVFVSLFNGIQYNDSDLMESVLLRLVGLGFGLTPTMDDILTGLAYIFMYIGRHGGDLPDGCTMFFELLRKERFYKRTSDISAAYICSASNGEIFSLIEAASAALFSSPLSVNLSQNIESLLAIGSDSGGNIMVGIIIGLNFFIKIFHNFIPVTY